MGSKGSDWLIVFIMFSAWITRPVVVVQGSSERSFTRDSLDSFIYNYTLKKTRIQHTGKLYDVMPPSNLTGIRASVVRFRARTLWRNGTNHSSISIPQGAIPWPFTKRVDIVYQNLGNLSSAYYNVPNHTLVAPVVGFLAYNPNRSSRNFGIIDLKLLRSDWITVSFPYISNKENGNATRKCVRFDTNGTLELSNMTTASSCAVTKQGHFSVVIPCQAKKDKKKKKLWVIGIVAGVLGLVLLIVLGIVGRKWIRRKRIKKMEKETERSEGLDTIWIAGQSRMPSASGIRTQPVLENSYVP